MRECINELQGIEKFLSFFLRRLSFPRDVFKPKNDKNAFSEIFSFSQTSNNRKDFRLITYTSQKIRIVLQNLIGNIMYEQYIVNVEHACILPNNQHSTYC